MEPNKTTYHQQAYEFTKSQILNLKLKPGQYILDTDIAAQLKVSRTPVREAFHRLEQEGLLVYEARRGWRVYALSLDDIHEIFDLKELVEGMVVRKAAHCPNLPEYAPRLEAVMADLRLAAEQEDVDAWLRADAALHELFFEMAGSQRAAGLIRGLNEQWHRLRIGFTVRKERMKRSAVEHEQVVRSVLMGDGEQAEIQIRRHLNNVRSELVELLVNMVLPFARDGI
jgi:DNA-binding GntR family transcriptional regulator